MGHGALLPRSQQFGSTDEPVALKLRAFSEHQLLNKGPSPYGPCLRAVLLRAVLAGLSGKTYTR